MAYPDHQKNVSLTPKPDTVTTITNVRANYCIDEREVRRDPWSVSLHVRQIVIVKRVQRFFVRILGCSNITTDTITMLRQATL